MGIWAAAGSRHETEHEHGMAHFVEHMLFKGTPQRTAEEISRQVEGTGASIDGFTVEDHTAYQIKGPAEKFGQLFEILADLYSHPVFDADDIASERQVICEEIAMVRDQPAQLLDDLISEAVWGAQHPLGRSITGTEDSLESFTRQDIASFYSRAYRGPQTVISVAGKLDHDTVAEAVAQHFAALPSGENMIPQPANTTLSQHLSLLGENQEQTHLALSFRNVDRHHPTRHAHRLLNTVLGENMSSRLFQTIREQRGLCYEVQSDLIHFADAGALQIYLALTPTNLSEALDVIHQILEDLRKNGIQKSELEEAKSYLIGQNQISLENTSSQMMWAGESLLYFDEWIDPDKVHEQLNQTTLEEVQEAANNTFDFQTLSSALIGSAKAQKHLKAWLPTS